MFSSSIHLVRHNISFRSVLLHFMIYKSDCDSDRSEGFSSMFLHCLYLYNQSGISGDIALITYCELSHEIIEFYVIISDGGQGPL